MVLDGFANFVRVSTAESVDSTQTTLTVTDTSEFPSEDHNTVLWDSAQYPRSDQDPDVEVIRVTAVDTSTDTLTISRGQEGTTAVSHPDQSELIVAPTAKMFSDIESELQTRLANGDDFDGQSSSDFVDVRSLTLTDELGNPTYATLADVPTNLPEGTQVYVEDENAIYVEDGT